MRVFVIGGGGREHALVYKIAQSPRVTQIFCAPGNAGIAELAECVDLGQADIPSLLKFAKDKKIDLTVVGPEAPLCDGIVDEFQEHGLRIFGPSKRAAELEGNKVFCKELLVRHLIPTAGSRSFTSAEEALQYVLVRDEFPVVVKASGLAAGKGVMICANYEEAEVAIGDCLQQEKFGEAGKRILIEEFLSGEEASILAFTDGRTIAIMESSQDHKAAFDQDQGPNTGGMGAYTPAPVVNLSVLSDVEEQILVPLVHGLNRENRRYVGVLYVGLMIANTGCKVLECNARFGDPEAQPLLLRLKTDIVDVMDAVVDGRLADLTLDWDPRPAVCVVLASEGYPGPYTQGVEIKGLDQVPQDDDLQVFHAGTSVSRKKIVTAGGRVLSVTALGDTLEAAKKRAYEAADLIEFEGKHFRTDIADKGIRRMS